MDHADLIAEFPVIEKLTPAERIQLARERRALQLMKWRERERLDPTSTAGRSAHVLFKSGIALLEATARNDVAEVQRLLADKADPNSHNEDGLTPLHQCAIDNNEELLVILLDEGADVNAQDTELWTPLHAAACCAHIQIVRHLIDRGANLLAVNADGNMPYDICDDDGCLDVIESEMARRGISQEDVDEERGAAERRMLADMKWLHQHGASLDYRDLDGATPLHLAAANGYYDVAAFLLRCGVAPDIPDDDSWLPIHAAACWAQPDLVELLVECGADVNAQTEASETPLDLCEDETTRHVILTLQAEAARRRRLAFPRDSRRQSRKRKSISKFESPQQPPLPTNDSPFSARGAIRRLSLRDRAGVTLARLEARREAALLRSWSLEDTSAAAVNNTDEKSRPAGEKIEAAPPQSDSKEGKSDSEDANTVSADGGKEESPKRKKRAPERPKQLSPDEWLEKLQEEDKISSTPEVPCRKDKETRRRKERKKEGEDEGGVGRNGEVGLPAPPDTRTFRNPSDVIVGPARGGKRFPRHCCSLL